MGRRLLYISAGLRKFGRLRLKTKRAKWFVLAELQWRFWIKNKVDYPIFVLETNIYTINGLQT
jgi:hypothetical protein